MEEHSSLSTSGEETIYTLEGCSEVNPIAMIKNKYGNIVYVGNMKNNHREGYGIQFDGNQYNPVCLYEGEWKDGKKVAGGIAFVELSSLSSENQLIQKDYTFYNLFTQLTLNDSNSLHNIMVNCIQNLVISNGCYMEDKIDFQEMKNLTFLSIGENSCKNVSRVVMENSQLTRIEIGKNSFTTSGPTEKLFTILNCPKLTNLRIHSNSFREFSLFSIKYAPLLTEIVIGDVNVDENAHNFMNVAVINIESMDSLQRLILGNHSFPNTKDLYLNRLPVLKDLHIGEKALIKLETLSLRNLPQLKTLQIDTSLQYLNEIHLMNLDKLKKIQTPVPLSSIPGLIYYYSIHKRLITSFSNQLTSEWKAHTNEELFFTYNQEDSKNLETIQKLKAHNFKWKSIEMIQKDLISGINKKRTKFYEALQQTSYTTVVPDAYLYSLQRPLQYTTLSTSFLPNTIENLPSTTSSSSFMDKSSMNSTFLRSSTITKTLTSSGDDYAVKNSSDLLLLYSSQLQRQIQKLVISEAVDMTELKITMFPRLVAVRILKNSIPCVSLLSIHNNPMLQYINIEEGCGNGESIEVKDEESEFSRIVSISLNSSLKEIMIGDGCFNEFDKFELNNVDFLKTIQIGKCTTEYEKKLPIFGKVKSLHLLALPSLMNLSFGDNSFPLCEQLVIEGGKIKSQSEEILHGDNNNMNNLHAIQFGGKSFMKNLVFTMTNLPRLNHILCFPMSLSCCTQVTCTNIKSLFFFTIMNNSLNHITQISIENVDPIVYTTLQKNSPNANITNIHENSEKEYNDSPYHYECKYCGNKTFITVKPKMKRKDARVYKFISILLAIPFLVLLCLYSILHEQYLFIPNDVFIVLLIVEIIFFILDFLSKGYITCKKCKAKNFWKTITKID